MKKFLKVCLGISLILLAWNNLAPADVNLPYNLKNLLISELITKPRTWTAPQTFNSGVTLPTLVSGLSGTSAYKTTFYGGMTVYPLSGTTPPSLYVDPVTGKIGIGTTGPEAELDVRGDIYIKTGTPTITLESTSNDDRKIITTFDGVAVGELLYAYNGSNWYITNKYADNLNEYTLGNIIFSTYNTERVRITNNGNFIVQSGNVGMGTTTLSNGAKTLEFGSGTTPTTFPNPGFIALVRSGVSEMFAFDRAGNFNQISAHDPETGEPYHYSFNVYTGRTVRQYLATGARTDYYDTSIKVNPEIEYKKEWTKAWVAGRCKSGLTPTQIETDAAVSKDFKFDWNKMPKFVRDAWEK